MEWASELPTCNGYYWLKDEVGVTMVEVFGFDKMWPEVFWMGNDCESDLDAISGDALWMGPLEVPK